MVAVAAASGRRLLSGSPVARELPHPSHLIGWRPIGEQDGCRSAPHGSQQHDQKRRGNRRRRKGGEKVPSPPLVVVVQTRHNPRPLFLRLPPAPERISSESGSPPLLTVASSARSQKSFFFDKKRTLTRFFSPLVFFFQSRRSVSSTSPYTLVDFVSVYFYSKVNSPVIGLCSACIFFDTKRSKCNSSRTTEC